MKKLNKLIRRLVLASLVLFAGTTMFAQNIELNPSSKGTKISESTFKGFSSTFSFNNIESSTMKTEAGDFSTLSIANTVNGGDLGAPALPIARELVAVPFGATPIVKVVSYTTTDYNLADYGIERVSPQQPSYSKSTKEEDMVFHYDEKAYQTRSLGNAPEVSFEVMGTMRGVQIGALQVEPVSYNPANNTIRVYNDIELEVVFENADVAKTEQMLVESYSPYFNVVYKQLFNSRAINDVYEDHPDLFNAPVHMLVVANRMFEDALQPWIQWKTEKGFYMTVAYTDEIGTTANAIKTYIKEEYEENNHSFVIVVGDKTQVAPSTSSGTASNRVSDLYYASVDGDYFPDMYHSRMPCETVAQLESLLHKILQYEQYTMADPSYLDNVLMIAGADGYWNPRVGQPAIQYATNYYFNEAHGFENVYTYLGPYYTGCYNHLSTGVGFANYTAHGSETSWADPSFTVSSVASLSNTDKYFWAMGNCCNAADWGYSQTSFAEAMVRADEKGAFGYIGSCPVTYWWEDYYFAVGATTVINRMPTQEETEFGCYDAFWTDDSYNVLASVPFVGNLAVAHAHIEGGYESAASTQYYFEAYHTLGDASVMPYRTMPESNDVSHLPTLPLGVDFYNITAKPGSYVGISQNGVLFGAGIVDASGSTDIPMTPITSGGDVKIVVTHQQCAPYTATVPAAALEGAYVSVASCTPQEIPLNQDINLSIVVRNVGTDATTATSTITLSCEEDFVTFTDAEGTFATLAADATTTLTDEFSIKVAEGVENGTTFAVRYSITDGADTWEGTIPFTVVAPIVTFKEFVYAGSYVPGETYTVMAKFENIGQYKATNAVVTLSTTSTAITIEEDEFEIGSIDPNGVGTAMFNVTVDASSSDTEVHELEFVLNADNGITVEGSGLMRNVCSVEFILNDDYGDGWNNSSLTVKFDDGTPDVNLTLEDGSSITYVLDIGSSTVVSVYFNNGGYYAYECSYIIKYKDGDQIYASDSGFTPPTGLNVEFEVSCGAGDVSGELNPVQNLEAEVEMNQVTLTWDAPRALVDYIIERNGVEITQTEETTFVDSELEGGEYTYAVIANYEEGESMPAMVVVEIGLSIDENGEVMFAIYPNPAKDVVNINTNAAKFDYQLINSVGQVVLNGTSNGAHQINVSNINKGVYFLKIVADGETMINKLSIQ